MVPVPARSSGWQASDYKISGWSYVTTTAPTVDAIKNALNTYGPVNTTMEVYSDFFYYSSGVYHIRRVPTRAAMQY